MNLRACSRLLYGMKRRDLYCWPVTVSERSRCTTRITEASSGSHPKSKRSLRMTLCRRSLDLESLNQYLTFGFVQPPRTMFQHIRKLAPGERLTAGTERPQETGSLLGASRRWRAEVRHLRSRGIEEHVREIRCRLERSVEACLVADVPVGAFLSGGVDSSAVVALMSQKLGRRVESVTLSYPISRIVTNLPFARMRPTIRARIYIQSSCGPKTLKKRSLSACTTLTSLLPILRALIRLSHRSVCALWACRLRLWERARMNCFLDIRPT